MLGLENEVIVFLRLEQRNDLIPARVLAQAMHHLPAKIGTPSPEIIVHVNHRNAGLLRPLFEAEKFTGQRPGEAQQLFGLGKIKIVYDVDQQQRYLGFVRSAAVKVPISYWHS